VGFVRDFHELSALRDFINATIDHKHLNEVFGHDRTSTEVISQWLYDWCRARWPEVVAVRVSRTLGPNTDHEGKHPHQRAFWPDSASGGTTRRPANDIRAYGRLRLSLRLVRHSLCRVAGVPRRMGADDTNRNRGAHR